MVSVNEGGQLAARQWAGDRFANYVPAAACLRIDKQPPFHDEM